MLAQVLDRGPRPGMHLVFVGEKGPILRAHASKISREQYTGVVVAYDVGHDQANVPSGGQRRLWVRRRGHNVCVGARCVGVAVRLVRRIAGSVLAHPRAGPRRCCLWKRVKRRINVEDILPTTSRAWTHATRKRTDLRPIGQRRFRLDLEHNLGPRRLDRAVGRAHDWLTRPWSGQERSLLPSGMVQDILGGVCPSRRRLHHLGSDHGSSFPASSRPASLTSVQSSVELRRRR